MKQVNISLRQKTIVEIERIACEQEMSRSTFLRQVITDKLKEMTSPKQGAQTCETSKPADTPIKGVRT